MKRQLFLASGALALAVIFVGTALPATAGGAGHTRPPSGGSSGSGRASGHASSGGTSHGSHHAPTRAQGHATYGYGYGYGYGGWWGYDDWWPWYYGPYWSVGVTWGWPGYWGNCAYGYPGCYAYPYYPGYAGGYELGPAVVETAVVPKKASLLLDGEPIGQARDFNGTWDTLRLEPGRHVLRFDAPGYMSLEVGIDAQAGRRYRIAYELHPGEGRDPRSVSAPPAGESPVTPAPNFGSDLSAPDSRASGEGAGLARGFLRVQVTPSDAAVYLDGEFLGRGDELAHLHGAIPVAVGPHRIEVVRPGYRNGVATVEVGQNPRPTEVRVDLAREGGSAL